MPSGTAEKGARGIFLSYKSDDAGIVRTIAEQLMAIGVRVWFAEYAISWIGRMEFEQAIRRGILASGCGVCFTNPGYFHSEFCAVELKTLLETKPHGRLLEVRLEDLPEGFSSRMPEDVRSVLFDDYNAALAEILMTLRPGLRHPGISAEDRELRHYWTTGGNRFSIDVRGWKVRPQGKNRELAEYPMGGIALQRRIGLHILRGTLTVTREMNDDPCIRDGTMDDIVYFKRAFAYGGASWRKAACDGLHLFRIHGFRQLGFTTFSGNKFGRSYTAAFPQPPGHGSIQFKFSFWTRCSKSFFLAHARLLDHVFMSLDCADFLCPYDAIDSMDAFVLDHRTVQERAQQQARQIGADANTITTDWMRHHVNRKLFAPRGPSVLDFNLKIDVLVKTYPPELSAAVILKLPVGVQRPAIDAFAAISERWDRGSRDRAAEAMSCVLSLMNSSEARHVLFCMSPQTRNAVKHAKDRLVDSTLPARAEKGLSGRDSIETHLRTNGAGKVHGKNIEPDMVEIPPGEFLMGTSEQQVLDLCKRYGNWRPGMFERERPQRKVWLDSFRIDKHPVTNAQYKAFVDATGHPVPYRPEPLAKPYCWNPSTRTYPARLADHPVVLVAWHDAAEYANWAGKRLPTEAEWEKAARGTGGRLWPWGNTWDEEACNHGMGLYRGTSPVAEHPGSASPYGVMDMAGNVWEWCIDEFDPRYHTTTGTRSPRGQGAMRVVRGGCYFDEFPELYRCAVREAIPPDAWEVYRGFRCVKCAEHPLP